MYLGVVGEEEGRYEAAFVEFQLMTPGVNLQGGYLFLVLFMAVFMLLKEYYWL